MFSRPHHLLGDVHTELDLLPLSAHHSVEEELPDLGLVGAGEVRHGEGVTIFLGDVPEITAARDEGNVLSLLLQFLRRKDGRGRLEEDNYFCCLLTTL